jgi:hypothetical protein
MRDLRRTNPNEIAEEILKMSAYLAHRGDNRKEGDLKRTSKPFSRWCSSECPPWNVQPVMGGQHQQTRLSVEAPSEPN